MFHAFMMTNL